MTNSFCQSDELWNERRRRSRGEVKSHREDEKKEKKTEMMRRTRKDRWRETD